MLLFLVCGFGYLISAGETDRNIEVETGSETAMASEENRTEINRESGDKENSVIEFSLEEGSVTTTVATENEDDGRISLNTADKAGLMTLPYIGEVRAEAIIAYRSENGPFSNIRDVMKVKGIGQGIFNRIKDRIKV